MTPITHELDEKIRLQLESYSQTDQEYWSFRGEVARGNLHSYFQYAAMMLPQMQRILIGTILEVVPNIKRVYDPFAGSGTVMTEAMLRGLDFTGQDINPLAVLVCRAKSGPFYEEAIRNKTNNLIDSIKSDNSSRIEVDFPGSKKWFTNDVIVEISKVRRAIRKEPSLWCRRFFWVALAETVRLTSNSRTSTFKLHIRPMHEIEDRKASPVQIFEEIVKSNIESLSAHKKLLDKKTLVKNGRYTEKIDLILGDSSTGPSFDESQLHDLLVTSPPYGDNVSTVPYGQHSYLPLQCIDLQDIDEKVDRAYLATTHEIDSRSLGGSRKITPKDIKELADLSRSFKEIVGRLESEPRDRLGRVTAFCRDLNRCLTPILTALKPGSYMIWTVGNRCVAGHRMPTDSILLELLAAKGAVSVVRLNRSIPSKRMATKNSIANTMSMESVLVLRKGNN